MSDQSSPSNVLLLGMVFAHKALCPKRGQEFRDRVRCEALANLGYNVYTMDDKHDDSGIEEHVRANFADTRRMLNSMKKKWGDEGSDGTISVKFKHIILDYFFSPIGWARTRWNPKFFSSTLPALVENGIVDDSADGTLWLPNLSCIRENLEEFHAIINRYFIIEKLSLKDCKDHPLYHATDFVEDELLSCPDALTNVTQIKPLLDTTNNFPFLRLTARKNWRDYIATTPQNEKIKNKAKSTLLKRSRDDATIKHCDDETNNTDVETPLTPMKKRKTARSKTVAM